MNKNHALSIGKNADGTYTYTDDGGAVYNGHFCGDYFRFRGGDRVDDLTKD
jgi:hypothetical protein